MEGEEDCFMEAGVEYDYSVEVSPNINPVDITIDEQRPPLTSLKKQVSIYNIRSDLNKKVLKRCISSIYNNPPLPIYMLSIYTFFSPSVISRRDNDERR